LTISPTFIIDWINITLFVTMLKLTEKERHVESMSWHDYDAYASEVFSRFSGQFNLESFYFTPPQNEKNSSLVSFTTWGHKSKPVLICLGGVANVARRFDYLASALSSDCHVVCPDWLGRGLSDWLAPDVNYDLTAYVHQIQQLIAHLNVPTVSILGSSMGATVALEIFDQDSSLIDALILNDTGPFIDASSRSRRATTLAQDYVFKTPGDMLRKLGASQKNDGPLTQSVRLHNAHALTRWSNEKGGRIYRHDPRAMLSYQIAAMHDVDQWAKWASVICPVLVIRGMESNVFSLETLERMRSKPAMSVMHIPLTGHTPALADPNHIEWIKDWLTHAGLPEKEFCAIKA
jgi:pimeloyl-ACP methyl ester carboxylesterase